MEQPLLLPRRSLVDEACDAIVELIGRQGLRAGDLLPQAGDLEAALGVSRTVVREALAHMVARGLLRRDRRRLLIAEPGSEQLADVLKFRLEQATLTIRQLMELREVIEVHAAQLAAARRTGDDIAALTAAVAGMTNAEEDEAFTRHDIAFHRALATASGNPAFPMILDALGVLLSEHMHRTLAHWRSVHGNRDGVADRHRAVAEAVAARDAVRARECMQHEMDEARAAVEAEEQRTRRL